MPVLLMPKTKQPKACLENIHRLLTDQNRWTFASNEMGGVVMCNGKRVDGPTITAITRWCHTRAVMVGSQAVAEVIAELADEHRIHPVRDYLSDLTWDGTERISAWLVDYLGAEDSAYNRSIGRKWLISAVARAMKPGCKADCMLVLEGPQGILKSTAISTLCHDDAWFLEDLRDIHGKDALMQFGGKWIVEIAELQSFKGAENARLKAFLSTRVDNYRQPYARVGQDFPRSVVFAGSVNEDEYLKDPTGGRRFWCFQCGTIDLEGLKQNRDQLWAEALHAYKAKESWWLDDAKTIKAAQIQQENRRVEDPWEEKIAPFLDGKAETTIDEVLTHLETPAAGMQGPRPTIARTKADQMRAADVLKCLGWQKKRIGDHRIRSWIKAPTDTSPPDPPDPPTPSGVGLGETRRNSQQDPPDPPIAPVSESESRRSLNGGGPGGPGGSPTVQTHGSCGIPGDPPLTAEVGHPKVGRGSPRSRANSSRNSVGTCAWCHETIPASDGRYTATSSGEVLHNRCVDEWSQG
jgi:predicted P-loop ATPase